MDMQNRLGNVRHEEDIKVAYIEDVIFLDK